MTTSATTHVESKELEDFFENAAVGMLWVGPDGTVLRANKRKLELLGYTKEEFVGHNIGEFHPDKKNMETVFSKLQAGETIHNWEVGLTCKDGSLKKLLLDSNALFENGKFVHTRCVTREKP